MIDSAPAGYVRLCIRGGIMMASESIAAWASEQVQLHGSLERFARGEPDMRVIRGRGPSYLVELPGRGIGMLRRLRHGGLLAGITGDRFPKAAVPRPLNELLTSVYLRERGILTPEVLAACVYPGWWHYRGEILRDYRADCCDLAAFLFESEATEESREQAVTEAVRMAAKLAGAGVCHPDFNARNLLVCRAGSSLQLLVIDLEKSSRGSGPPGPALRRMRGRLRHSLEKLEGSGARRLPGKVWKILTEPSDGE